MKCIDEIPASELKGKRVLLRTGMDLPVDDDGNVSDVFRLERSLPTVGFLSKSGARTIIASKVGHKPKDKISIAPVAEALRKYVPVVFVPDLTGIVAHQAVGAMKDGEMIMIENLQRDPREIAGDDSYAKELSTLADIYVNDAFPSAHRGSATMIGVPKFLPSYAGLLMRNEVNEIDAARAPEHPSLAILGGAKFETKAPLIKLLLEKYDHVFITGALANDVFKARGLPVGRSLISKELPGEDILSNPHFLAPLDVTTETPDGQAHVKKPQDVQPDDKVVDIGPDTVAMLAPHIAAAKFILWAGPTGMYESGYIHYTQAVAELISKNEGKKVIGGGDTIAAIEATGVSQKDLGFLSTGGGAMLEYLLKGTLPGIAALS
ncbi:phosphoglycerate kinase [Candidatus Kaiserbacteria bacterium RIFCSPHIGHO2_02_FULL_55_20]|uniref:Phosphoglycerate kinase n=1 Tax=Candidatus Kaiserbacteria bacterium RIFCSPHIGHO2_02_FULL_55_20 TaxID=1798497 RepID=A0A1F6DVJ3_9BACT|nr:MAG: phosphoglycerate kinase [Candidatus Kaiserbacteria bacterium RIFCSPHIGHO2_01_FULL_55_37]OGG65290.1 MAG: phosphoglycerate kinase [Candidatus Kaiserbacteria bacterium RIFCSPHIGHO2_02_FULL_55_20]